METHGKNQKLKQTNMKTIPKTNSQIAKQLGSAGGKKSVQVRFGGKKKEEISDIMKKVRMSSKEINERHEKFGKAFLEALRNTPREDHF